MNTNLRRVIGKLTVPSSENEKASRGARRTLSYVRRHFRELDGCGELSRLREDYLHSN